MLLLCRRIIFHHRVDRGVAGFRGRCRRGLRDREDLIYRVPHRLDRDRSSCRWRENNAGRPRSQETCYAIEFPGSLQSASNATPAASVMAADFDRLSTDFRAFIGDCEKLLLTSAQTLSGEGAAVAACRIRAPDGRRASEARCAQDHGDASGGARAT